jgi:hypothetical protein
MQLITEITRKNNKNITFGFLVIFADEFGHQAVRREELDSVKKAIIIPNPDNPITVDSGIVVGWHIYTDETRLHQDFHLQIWRPTHQRPFSSAMRFGFKLVGDIRVVSLWTGYSHILLYPEDRFRVQSGDVIGLYFPG